MKESESFAFDDKSKDQKRSKKRSNPSETEIEKKRKRNLAAKISRDKKIQKLKDEDVELQRAIELNNRLKNYKHCLKDEVLKCCVDTLVSQIKISDADSLVTSFRNSGLGCTAKMLEEKLRNERNQAESVIELIYDPQPIICQPMLINSSIEQFQYDNSKRIGPVINQSRTLISTDTNVSKLINERICTKQDSFDDDCSVNKFNEIFNVPEPQLPEVVNQVERNFPIELLRILSNSEMEIDAIELSLLPPFDFDATEMLFEQLNIS